jgi:mono/diheme cytochrome c family protein
MKAPIVICALLLLSGCERAMHDMYDQPKYPPGAPSPLFSDGHAGRAPPFGTMVAAGGEMAATSSGRLGQAVDAAAASQSGTGGYLALLQRGRARYDIYCAPCHGLTGDGHGMVVARGFPAPPPLTRRDMLDAPDAQLTQAIRRGYGVMYPLADRVDAHDLEAIVAYIRALQLSQHAPAAQLSGQDRAALSGTRQAAR